MKRLMKSMVLMAAAAVALASCAKENVSEQDNGGQKFAEVSFKAEIPAYKTTKSTIDVDDLVFNTRWAEGEQMGLMCEYITSKTNEIYNLCGTYSKGVFTAKFPEHKGMWYYYGYYPYQASDDKTDHHVNIPFGAERVQNGNDFNSAYDIMCAEYVGVEDAEQGKTDSGDNITFNMVRQTALLYFHFTTEGFDEPLTKATFTVEGDPIAADTYSLYYYGQNLNSLSHGVSWTTGDSQSITLTFTNAPSSKDFNLWFNILPYAEGLRENGIKNLKLVVETENKTLTLKADAEEMYLPGNISKVEFTNVPASNWKNKTTPTPPATKVYYEKVTTAPTDWSGDYLIVYEDGSVAFDGSLETLDVANNGKAVTIINNQIEATEETDAISFLIEAVDGGYSVLSASGSYIGRDASSNGLNSGSNAYINSIAFTNNTLTIKGKGGATLLYNASSGQTRFRYFTSSQKAIALYKRSKNIDRPTVPSLTLSDGAATVAADAVTISFDVTSNVDWTVSTDAEWITDWTKSGSNDGTVTIKFDANTKAARTAEFTVKSADNTISKTFTLTQKAAGAATTNTVTYDFTKIDGFADWDTGYSEHVVNYTEAIVTFKSANKNTSTIKDQPVTKGSDVSVVMTGTKSIKSVKFVCKQWGTKTQTITLNTSTDGGKTYTATSTNSSNFTLSATDLADGINAIKFTFSSGNQIGISSLEITYAE